MIICNSFFLTTLKKMQTSCTVFDKSMSKGIFMTQYYSADREEKINENYENDAKNTGGSEYQITTLSSRISRVAVHIKKNPKDVSSIRGLVQMVNARKKLLRYLRNQDENRFFKVCSLLKIRIQKKK
nr:plastidial 30S ribosomal protein S15 [Cryptomonas paramecium]